VNAVLPDARRIGIIKGLLYVGARCCVGSKGVLGRLRHLGTLPRPQGGKAAGITVLDETVDHVDALVIYDSVKGGAPTIFRLRKPF